MRRRNRELSAFSMATIDLFACATGAFILLTLVLLPYYLDVDRDVVRELRETLTAREAELADTRETLVERETALADAEAALERSRTAETACASELETAGRENAALRTELARSESDLRAEIADLAAANAALADSNTELENLVRACNTVAQQSFVLVLMSWDTADDIDLHVVDPDGRRYYYRTRDHDGSAASFEEDNVRGPGNEIWMHPSAEPGEYSVAFNFFRRRSSGVVTVRGTVFHQRGRLELPTTTLNEEHGARHEEATPVATLTVDAQGRVMSR